VQSYLAWSQKDRDAHGAALQTIDTELTASGELLGTEGLAVPDEAMLVRGEKGGMPVTDGVFPDSKEFLLGYWIVDVQTPERAYAIAGRISAAPGPGQIGVTGCPQQAPESAELRKAK
jgi:hypothetical protein